MLLSSEEVDNRLSSPLNLINRLRRVTADREQLVMFGVQPDSRGGEVVSLPPSIDSLIDGIDERLNVNEIESAAKSILLSSMKELAVRLPEVQRPEKLSTIAADMNKIIAQTHESKMMRNQTNNIQVMIYAPKIRDEEQFDSITVNE